MLGEYFIDICLNACCSIDTDKKGYKEVFSNILSILNVYFNEVPEDLRPLEFRDKIDVLYKLSKERCENSNFNFEILMAKVVETESHRSLIPVLEEKRKIYTDVEYLEISRLISNRRKLYEVLKGKNRLQDVLSQIDISGPGEEEKIIKSWENEISSANENLIKFRKLEDIGSASSLDLMHDDYTPMFKKLFDSVDTTKVLPSGIRYIDQRLVTGGFENRRFYIFGGTSGVGKSIMLIHLICSAIKLSKNQKADDGKIPTYLYITAENLIDETWIRFYCCLTDTPHQVLADRLRKISTDYQARNIFHDEESKKDAEKIISDFNKQMQEEVRTILSECGANVIFKYVPMNETTIRDLESIINYVSSENYLRCVYIDYLDLISSGRNLEYRFELSVVAQGFKNIAIAYNIPVLTVTQLNREGYKNQAPSLTQMSESMDKVNKADGIFFLNEGQPKFANVGNTKYKIVVITLLKQRNGPLGEPYNIGLPTEHLNGDPIFCFKYHELPAIKIDEQSSEIDKRSQGAITQPWNVLISEDSPTTENKYDSTSKSKKGSPNDILSEDEFGDFLSDMV